MENCHSFYFTFTRLWHQIHKQKKQTNNKKNSVFHCEVMCRLRQFNDKNSNVGFSGQHVCSFFHPDQLWREFTKFTGCCRVANIAPGNSKRHKMKCLGGRRQIELVDFECDFEVCHLHHISLVAVINAKDSVLPIASNFFPLLFHSTDASVGWRHAVTLTLKRCAHLCWATKDMTCVTGKIEGGKGGRRWWKERPGGIKALGEEVKKVHFSLDSLSPSMLWGYPSPCI